MPALAAAMIRRPAAKTTRGKLAVAADAVDLSTPEPDEGVTAHGGLPAAGEEGAGARELSKATANKWLIFAAKWMRDSDQLVVRLDSLTGDVTCTVHQDNVWRSIDVTSHAARTALCNMVSATVSWGECHRNPEVVRFLRAPAMLSARLFSQQVSVGAAWRRG